MHERIVNPAYIHPRASGANIDIVSIQLAEYPLGLSAYVHPRARNPHTLNSDFEHRSHI